MAIYIEAWQNDGKPDAESRIKTMQVKSKSHAKSAAALFGSRIPQCVRVTLLYTGNMSRRRSIQTLWLAPGYVDALG